MIDGSRLRPSMRVVKKKETRPPSIYIYIYTPRPAVSSPKHLSVSHWYQEIFHGMTRARTMEWGGGVIAIHTHRRRSRRASAFKGRERRGGRRRSEWLLLKSTKRRVHVCVRAYTRSRLFVDRTETRLFPRLCATPRVRHVDLRPDLERKGGIFEECSLPELTLLLPSSLYLLIPLALARASDKHCGYGRDFFSDVLLTVEIRL